MRAALASKKVSNANKNNNSGQTMEKFDQTIPHLMLFLLSTELSNDGMLHLNG